MSSKAEAESRYETLIKTYGVKWGSKVPASALAELRECSKFLSFKEKLRIELKVTGVGSSA